MFNFLKPLKPVFEKKRYKCPFYGFASGTMFSSDAPIFMDTDGNQCALATSSFSPCRMEKEGNVPDWNNCSLNCKDKESKEALLFIKKNFKIFPKEFVPQGKSPWKGLSFSKWWKYIMEKQ